ncbi:polymorphic toxin-type HINT domain-containing protein [Leptolyngbya sp. 7M]|uniref:polymorphic toxin-type HINT domain-containing protein n=1 Tax=Leptolyngbya sp. 7M TaxID=2812896 RepID=UPI001B8C4F71|nr:polymorphic toxin-type HINT domain-containing protein [Leptolyngbya sp. 7M]QYO62563.1 Hint domain-containing protein [Leptolyngbya sp. 7M]
MSLALDLTPGVGELKGLVEAVTGKDLITGEDLAAWERMIGILPYLSDVGKLIQKAGDIARAVEAGSDAAKAAGAAGDLANAQKAAQQADQAADFLEQMAPGSPEALLARQSADEALEAACFVAGTLVLTPTGHRPIETLQVGEFVLAADPETGVVKACRILQTFVREVAVVLTMQVGEEIITCTPEHPFWVPGQGWTAAGQLSLGTALLTRAGQIVSVTAIERQVGLFAVYNFEVEALHTYFVSSLGILVHNTCDFGDLSNDLFADLPVVRPRSLDRIEPAPEQIRLTPDNLSSVQLNKPYIYVLDELNSLQIAPRGSSGQSGVKHTQLTGGGPAKAAGEILFRENGEVLINNQSGRYFRQSPEAINRVQRLLESQNLTVTQVSDAFGD